MAADVGICPANLPVVWAGHNSDVCDVPDIYQVMTAAGNDLGHTLGALGVIGTVDTLRILQSIDFGADSWGANPRRPESMKLQHVVRDLTGYDMGDAAHTAVVDAIATRRLLRLRLLRDAIFQDKQTRIVALRQVIGRIRWLRYIRREGQ
jgi:hypothetical protein